MRIPDGIEIVENRRQVVVFNPRWWRVDRWLYWAWLVMTGRPRGIARFTALVPGETGARVQEFALRVYEA